MECFIRGRNDSYYAIGQWNGEKMLVKSGSRIVKDTNPNFKIVRDVLKKRDNPEIVNEQGIVLVDVWFDSASSAAQFVTGNSTNGLRQWKEKCSRKALKEFV